MNINLNDPNIKVCQVNTTPLNLGETHFQLMFDE